MILSFRILASYVYHIVVTSIVEQAASYGEQPEISARSLLVTVFGDSIAPAGGEVWLGDLIKLVEPFSFSERLVRTSIYRLAAEGWFATERVGRRSRYSLSPTGRHEFVVAERRIYHPPADDWDGEWTIVFANVDQLGDDAKPGFLSALRWLGFGRLAAGVFGSPTATIEDVEYAATRSGLTTCPPTATARFADLATLVDQASFATDFGLAESIVTYESFVEKWDSAAATSIENGQDAFLVRTMMVHDFRRARLADPDLPVAILPNGWAGRDAYRRAANVFAAVDEAANTWLAESWELPTLSINRFPMTVSR